MASPLVHEKVWFEKPKFEAAERQYYENLAKVVFGSCISASMSNLLMDNKLRLNSETYNTASLNEKNAKKPNKSIMYLEGDFGSSHTEAVVKDEKCAKKDKKLRTKGRKRDMKREMNSKSSFQDDTLVKNNSLPVHGMKHIINPIPIVEAKSKSLLEKNGNAQASSLPNFHECPALNLKSAAQKHDLLEETEGSSVVPYAQSGHKSCIMENWCSFVKQEPPQKGSSNSPMANSLASEVAKARQHIKQSLECMDDIAVMAGINSDLVNRINGLEKENAGLKKLVEDLKNLAIGLDSRVKVLEGGKSTSAPVPVPAKPAKKQDDDDDGVDLFGSDSEEESEEAARIKEQRLAAYAEKKSKKPALIAKSNIILSVSPWDDETDMKKMEECVRTIKMDGLIWGASKLVPLAYGIHKLHISCVVEDDKVSVDLLQENIQNFEDYVQSVDIAAFNKV